MKLLPVYIPIIHVLAQVKPRYSSWLPRIGWVWWEQDGSSYRAQGAPEPCRAGWTFSDKLAAFCTVRAFERLTNRGVTILVIDVALM